MTFAQRRNRLTMHFSESIRVVERRLSVFACLGDDKTFSTVKIKKNCVKNACHCLSLGMQVPGPLAIRCVNSIGGRTDEIRLGWLGPLGGLAYQWQMTAPLSIFPVYHSVSPWQTVLCLWFRPRKTLVATSCDASRKSLKLQQKPTCLSSSVAARCSLCVVSKTKKHLYITQTFELLRPLRETEEASVYLTITRSKDRTRCFIGGAV
jgi:hypothetical protein